MNLPKYDLENYNAKVESIYERRCLLTGQLDNYSHPYEIVIGFPVSMGERGENWSFYYDELPDQEKLLKDFKMELSELGKACIPLKGQTQKSGHKRVLR